MRDWRTIPPAEQQAILAEARNLVGYVRWTEIGRRFDVRAACLRYCLDADYRKEECAKRAAWRSSVLKGSGSNYTASDPDPGDIAARLAEIPPDTRSPAEKLCGDPIPGRGARDRPIQPRDWLAISRRDRQENLWSAKLALSRRRASRSTETARAVST